MAGSSGENPSRGKLTAGLAHGTLVARTIAFVRDQLQPWRDDDSREPMDAEDQLNPQLCKFLDVAARRHFPMVHFHHEEPQGRRRTVDLAVTPTESITIGSRDYSIYTPFLVLEGKRLPAPSSDREREYLTGYEKRSGGIQRFKLGLHGASLDTAVMVGYIQDGSAREWYKKLNAWIKELAESPATEHDDWERDECLRGLTFHAQRATATSQSSHARSPGKKTGRMCLFHLWIDLHRGTVPGALQVSSSVTDRRRKRQ